MQDNIIVFLKKTLSTTLLLLLLSIPQTTHANPENTYVLKYGTNDNRLFEKIKPSMPFHYWPVKSNTYSLLISPIFSGLYMLTETESPEYQPVIAAEQPIVSKENQDILTLTIKLRDDLRFSENDVLKAEDVVYTYKLIMTPKLNSSAYYSLANSLGSNDSVVAVDDYTVKFHFKQVVGSVYLFLTLPIVSKTIYQSVSFVDYASLDPVDYLKGIGPFRLADVKDNQVIFSKNPEWVKTGLDGPNVDYLVIMVISRNADALQLLEQGELDVLSPEYNFYDYDLKDLNPSVISKTVFDLDSMRLVVNQIHPVWGHTAQLSAYLGKEFTYSTGTSCNVSSFWDEISLHQMNETTRVMAAKLVRQAISIIIPRDNISNIVWNNATVPAPTTVPPTAIDWNDQLAPYNTSVEKAQDKIIEAFSLAGWNNITKENITDGKIPITELYKVFPQWNTTILTLDGWGQAIFTAVGIGIALKQIGINVEVKAIDWKQYFERTFYYPVQNTGEEQIPAPVPLYNDNGYDFFWSENLYGLEWNPYFQYFSRAYRPVGLNIENWYDEKTDQLILEYSLEIDVNKRIEISKQLQEYFYDALPVVPLHYRTKIICWNNNTQGINTQLLLINTLNWWQVYTQTSEEPPISTSKTTTTNKSGFLASQPILYYAFLISSLALITTYRRAKKKATR